MGLWFVCAEAVPVTTSPEVVFGIFVVVVVLSTSIGTKQKPTTENSHE